MWDYLDSWGFLQGIGSWFDFLLLLHFYLIYLIMDAILTHLGQSNPPGTSSRGGVGKSMYVCALA